MNMRPDPYKRSYIQRCVGPVTQGVSVSQHDRVAVIDLSMT
jgi:hypothetical protein